MILGGVHSQFISSHRGDSSSIYCVDWAPDECIVVCACTYTFTMDYSFTLLNWCWISFSSSSEVFFHPVKTIFVSLLYSFLILFMLRVCIVCYIETSCCHRLVCAHLLSKGTNQRTRLSRVKKNKGKRGFAWKGFRVTDSWQRGMRRSGGQQAQDRLRPRIESTIVTCLLKPWLKRV